jgi:hypothetical protein
MKEEDIQFQALVHLALVFWAPSKLTLMEHLTTQMKQSYQAKTFN